MDKYKGIPENQLNTRSEKLPEKSELEARLDEIFSGEQVSSEEQFDSLVTKVFGEICGEWGKEQFHDYVLPTIKSIYGNNYRSAGERILKIIDQGASQPRNEIGNYFKNTIQESEKEFSKLDRGEIIKNLELIINESIKEQADRFGKNKAIIAVVIFGSYARGNFSKHSDLDIIYVSATKEEGLYKAKEERYVNFSEVFNGQLRNRLKLDIDNDVGGTIPITNEDELRDNVHNSEGLIKGSYMIMSPYPEVKERLERILTKENIDPARPMP